MWGRPPPPQVSLQELLELLEAELLLLLLELQPLLHSLHL